MMKKVLKHLDRIEEYAVTLFLSLMTIIVFAQVVCRFVLKSSLPWSEELARYLLVWTTFIGASMGVKMGAHIGVEAFVLMLPQRFRKIVSIITYVLCGFFTAVVCVFSIQIIMTQMSTGQVSPAMKVPMWVVYSAIPIGTALMTFRYLQVLVKEVVVLKREAI